MDLELIVGAIIGGIIATYVLLVMSLWINRFGLPRLDFARAMTNLTYGEQFGGEGPYWAGTIVIYFNGVIFALLFSTVVGQYLPGIPVFRGAVWGVFLWFMSGIFFVPLILREGFFLSHIHKMAWFSSLIVHGLWGIIVGWLSPIAGFTPS